ncbi:MAG: ABC transporter ATP-binding protein [candidate division WOR-3 bacterium]
MENRKVKIEIIDLRFSYEDKKEVLKGINLKVYENETLSIIGENGSGKTTFLLCIAGLLKYKGKVLIDGKEFNESLRKKIGFLFENPDDSLFMPKVYDDVAFGPKNFGFNGNLDEIVKDALKKAGVSGFEERIPHHLSFGEKKKVSLATILSYNPEILLLDEPTLGLSPKSRIEFIKLIKNLKGTKIIATHDINLLEKISDRIIVLNEGKIEKEEYLLNL